MMNVEGYTLSRAQASLILHKVADLPRPFDLNVSLNTNLKVLMKEQWSVQIMNGETNLIVLDILESKIVTIHGAH